MSPLLRNVLSKFAESRKFVYANAKERVQKSSGNYNSHKGSKIHHPEA
jgi:hypothetical protein